MKRHFQKNKASESNPTTLETGNSSPATPAPSISVPPRRNERMRPRIENVAAVIGLSRFPRFLALPELAAELSRAT